MKKFLLTAILFLTATLSFTQNLGGTLMKNTVIVKRSATTLDTLALEAKKQFIAPAPILNLYHKQQK